MLAALLISGWNWLLPAVGLSGAVLLILFWAYGRTPVSGGVRVMCALLKLMGVLALAACLLEPLWSGQRAQPGANVFLLLADNSQGMQIKDRGETQSRGALLHAALTDAKASWQPQLEENFQVRRYLFDARLQSTRNFSEQLFEGRATDMGTALRTLAERYKGQPVAGILLFTDGNATDIANGSPALEGLPPIYPVVMGGNQPVKDIAILKVTVSQTSFEDAPVSIQADVTVAGYSGASVVAQLLEVRDQFPLSQTNKDTQSKTTVKASLKIVAVTNGAANPFEKIVSEQTLPVAGEKETLPFRFQIRPEKNGVLFYRLRVSAKNELAQFTKPELTTEATLANNSRVLVVDRGKGPHRILYVSGRPNWEFKFLNRAVQEDEQIQLVGLIRIAKREPKFEFRGRAGESSNPLFRGFGNQSKEEVERYDKPVLVRLNTRDELELRGGFPKTAEDLYAYQAIVVDDLEAEFFTPDQMTLLQKFVAERGGGFLMLGGMESFQQGKFQRTPICDMLPVYLDQPAESKAPGELHLSLTREGWLQPWARLRNNEGDEKNRLNAMPPFQLINRVRGIKPGASVIATVADGSATYPALVVERFGNGRTAALLIGDLWRWGLHQEDMQRDLGKSWRQLARWLVADVPNRIDCQVEQKRDANQSVQLQVRVRDKKFQPLDNATVTLNVRLVGQEPLAPASALSESASTNAVRLTAEAVLSESGLYEAMFVAREAGGYKAEAVVTDSSGVEVGRTEVGWTAEPAAEEFRSLSPNRTLLESIAKKTGGEVIALNELEKFSRDLPHRKAPVVENWTMPFWHQPAVFLFALACFVAEWGLRRYKGLA